MYNYINLVFIYIFKLLDSSHTDKVHYENKNVGFNLLDFTRVTQYHPSLTYCAFFEGEGGKTIGSNVETNIFRKIFHLRQAENFSKTWHKFYIVGKRDCMIFN